MGETAQEQHDRAIQEMDFSKINVQMAKNLIKKNEATSSNDNASPPSDIVEAVMRKHGFSRSQAEEQLEKFGA